MAESADMFLPPGGSVFDTLTGKEGPPMMRMFIIQGMFESISNFRRCTNRGKILVVAFVSMTFMIGDMRQFAV